MQKIISLNFVGAKLTLALYEGFHKDSFKSSNEIENKLQAPTYGEPKVSVQNIVYVSRHMENILKSIMRRDLYNIQILFISG